MWTILVYYPNEFREVWSVYVPASEYDEVEIAVEAIRKGVEGDGGKVIAYLSSAVRGFTAFPGHEEAIAEYRRFANL